MKGFLNFDRLIATQGIKVLYWIGSIIALIYPVIMIITGFVENYVGLVIVGLISLLTGQLMVRISCELLIVMFKMNDALTNVKKEIAVGTGQGSNVR